MPARCTCWLLLLVLIGCSSDPSEPSTAAGGTAAGGTGGDHSGGTGGLGGAGGASSQGGQGAQGGYGGQPVGGGMPQSDLDGDGIDDAVEAQQAYDYFPYLAMHPQDGCTLHGVVYRLSPHPAAPNLRMVWYTVLYQNDCGLNGHVGDNEAFGVVFDPTIPAPGGIRALRAISHQDTICEQTSTCGNLPGCQPCTHGTRFGLPYPVLFASINKHGGYLDEGKCDLSVICDTGGCELPPEADDPLLVNVGEPGAQLVNDLTGDGFITDANGWSEAVLFGYDPWGPDDFGNASDVATDLVDPVFVVDPQGC